MRTGESKPPSKSGMFELKQTEQQTDWSSDMGTPWSEAFKDHLQCVVERYFRRCHFETNDYRLSDGRPLSLTREPDETTGRISPGYHNLAQQKGCQGGHGGADEIVTRIVTRTKVQIVTRDLST